MKEASKLHYILILGLKQYSVMNAMPRNVSYVDPQAETILREKVAQQVH